MKISQKLLIIVGLTVLEVSITVGATFQISKGGRLHQLNSLHLKHNASFQGAVTRAEDGHEVTTDDFTEAILAVREQPILALDLIGPIDHIFMRLIGTEYAIDLIQEDIDDTDRALRALNAYEGRVIGRQELLAELRWASDKFTINSGLFEGPVTRTVSFMLRLMIPLILVLSLFNICFISYLSRSISSSIKTVIDLLRSGRLDPAHGTPLKAQVGGELGELIGVAEERLRADLMNVETNEELRKLIEDRTQSLLMARNEAEASLATKERFLANMSHEIRTPINGILCAADLVAQDLRADDPHQELTSIIQGSAGSLLNLLNDILDLSKVESGHLALETVAFDLDETVGHIASLLRLQAQAKGLEFEVLSRLDGSNRLVEGDPTRIRQVLVNLIGNAVKFTEAGAVTIEVDLVNGDGLSAELQVTVTDSGIGMTEQQLEGIFDRFTQADESTTRKYGGTGLGMSLSEELVKLMGGSIKAKSRLGEGTVFELKIPVQRRAEGPAPKTKPDRIVRDYGGACVLLVEDNRVNQKVASLVLARLGINVVVAENGAVALDLATDDVELILMDIQMPVMDGVEATRELRDRGWAKPIVALTANAFAEDRARYEEAGMTGFLAKPIQLPELVSVLDGHLTPSEERAA